MYRIRINFVGSQMYTIMNRIIEKTKGLFFIYI